MRKNGMKFPIAVMVCLAMVFCSCDVFARGDDRGHDRGGDRGYSRSYNQGDRHYYRDGRWYKYGWFGLGFVVSALTIGALVDSLPPRHTTVIVEGVPYYRDDVYYYRAAPVGGYVVVPAPVIVQPSPVIVQQSPQMPETATINIPNSRGGYTPVTLRRSGNGYVGPQGEYYAEHPTVDQLKALYGN